ncbi:MAG: cytochrome C oxidase subunit IV family protein [Verrucomicrobia bacterium]|nr:cytochrome C oxidase subunit IV family protein [Verrucomicrobiota bacterium]
MSEEHTEHSHTNYVKIWGILLVLLIISVIGPMTGIKAIILITAFGIAIVKAVMVAGYFMHLNVEKKIAWYILIATVAFLAVCFFGIAPDVMRSEGTNWKKHIPDHLKPAAVKEGAHH